MSHSAQETSRDSSIHSQELKGDRSDKHSAKRLIDKTENWNNSASSTNKGNDSTDVVNAAKASTPNRKLNSREKENQLSFTEVPPSGDQIKRQKLFLFSGDSLEDEGDDLDIAGPEGRPLDSALSHHSESDRDTLGSSSSELAALRSPSRELNNNSVASTSPEGDSDTPVDSPLPVTLKRSGKGTPHPGATRPPVGSDGELSAERKFGHVIDNQSVVHFHTSSASLKDNSGESTSAHRIVQPIVDSKPGAAPYTSQRLKPQGDTVKRSAASATFEADSLDLVKDSLELTPRADVKANNESREKLVDTFNTTDNSIHLGPPSTVNPAVYPVVSGKTGNEKEFSNNSDTTDALSVDEHEKELSAPEVLKSPQILKDRNESSPLIAHRSSGLSTRNPPHSSLPAEKPVYILRSDQKRSRSSSVQTSGRPSVSSQVKADQPPTPRTASGAQHAMRGPSSSNRVYVTSPTFSDDDETQYRLVSSRLDGEDDEDTYRELDIAAIQSQEANGLAGPKLSGAKHVTYSDRKGSTDQTSNSGHLSNPYGLKMAPRSEVTDDAARQGRIITHDPQHRLDTSDQQPPRPSRVRGISLPTGPTFDPRDEEDLQREISYQKDLRMRIADGNKKAEEDVPMLPLSSEDFARDSIDYVSVDETARAFVEAFKPDPSEDYHHPRIPFRNPPPLPQEFVDRRQKPADDHLMNGQFDNDEDIDYEDIRHQRVNPQVQPRFYHPHTDQVMDSSRYVEVGDTTDRSQVNARVTNGQPGQIDQTKRLSDHQARQKDQKLPGHPFNDHSFAVHLLNDHRHAGQQYNQSADYSDRSDFSGSQGGQKRTNKNTSEPTMEAVEPTPPKYDFVNSNKEDYGKPHPKSYTHIHEVSKEEKEKLNEIFIQPKVKPKKGILKKKGNTTDRMGSQNMDPGQFEEQGPEEEADLTTAEQMWAEKSSILARRKDSQGGTKRRGTLQKYSSDSSINQIKTQQKPLPVARKAFLTEMPTPPSQESSHQNQMALLPYSPRQADIQILPVSSQIILDDGQRISVDVNLKLIPTEPHFLPQPHYQQIPQQSNYQQIPQQLHYQQVPHQPHYQPSPQQPPNQPFYHSGMGNNRQYPSLPQYTEEDMVSLPPLDMTGQHNAGYRDNIVYMSPRERYSADEALRHSSHAEINPYSKIPPIQRSAEIGHPSSAPEQAGSYTDMFRKQKEKLQQRPWYRVYGLSDYRKMQKEVRLGTLGPDLDSEELKEKREKFKRQVDYAKFVMEKNKQDLLQKKPPAFPRPKEDNDIMSRRKLAEEYAKSVPKPLIKPRPTEYNNYELASERSPIAKHHRKPGDLMTPSPRLAKKPKEVDLLDIDKLRQRYEEDKQNEALIRRNTGNTEKYY